jgi:hypothetical protein
MVNLPVEILERILDFIVPENWSAPPDWDGTKDISFLELRLVSSKLDFFFLAVLNQLGLLVDQVTKLL